jgi:hypothetical protein
MLFSRPQLPSLFLVLGLALSAAVPNVKLATGIARRAAAGSRLECRTAVVDCAFGAIDAGDPILPSPATPLQSAKSASVRLADRAAPRPPTRWLLEGDVSDSDFLVSGFEPYRALEPFLYMVLAPGLAYLVGAFRLAAGRAAGGLDAP